MLVISSTQDGYAGPFSHALRRTDFADVKYFLIILLYLRSAGLSPS